MEHYPFGIMILYAAVDLLLMIGACQLCGTKPSRNRILGAVAVGGVYSGLCLMPGFYFLGNWFWHTVLLLLRIWIAFAPEGNRRVAGVVFAAMHLVVLCLGDGSEREFWAMLLAASGICLLSLLGFGDQSGKQFLPVKIAYMGRASEFTALVDTGNLLSDPVTGENVLIVPPKVAQSLLELSPEQIADPVETVRSGSYPGLRLIPYHTIGQKGGLLLGMRFRDVWIGDRNGPRTVAFAPNSIGDGKRFQALTGGMA